LADDRPRPSEKPLFHKISGHWMQRGLGLGLA